MTNKNIKKSIELGWVVLVITTRVNITVTCLYVKSLLLIWKSDTVDEISRNPTFKSFAVHLELRDGDLAPAPLTPGFSIEFEIRQIVECFGHHEILHTARQCYCRDMCKISFRSTEYIMSKSITQFHWISIEISLVGRAPG